MASQFAKVEKTETLTKAQMLLSTTAITMAHLKISLPQFIEVAKSALAGNFLGLNQKRVNTYQRTLN